MVVVTRLVVDKDVDALTTFPVTIAGFVGDSFVFEWWRRVLRDDVPGVQEAREEAEDAEEEVDEGVGGADAGFYPDCLGLVNGDRK